MSRKNFVFTGNGKRHGNPLLKKQRLIKLLCFGKAGLKKLAETFKTRRSKNKPETKYKQKLKKKETGRARLNPYIPISHLPDLSMPSYIHEKYIWQQSEEEIWGDLTREDMLELKRILNY